MRDPVTMGLVYTAIAAGVAGCLWLQRFLVRKTDQGLEKLARRRKP